jgi:hypothetical protein
MMYCAKCGSKMERNANGTWYACCNGVGYWWNEAPLLSDQWLGMPPSYKGFYFYRTGKWPNGLKPTNPIGV